MRRSNVGIKKAKLSGAEIRANRAKAEALVGYDAAMKELIGGKTTVTIVSSVYDSLLVGDLDAAKASLIALQRREQVNFLTFHPDGK